MFISLYMYFQRKEKKKKKIFEVFLGGLSLELLDNVNNFLQDVLIRTLTTDEIKLNPIDAEDPEVSSFNMLIYRCINIILWEWEDQLFTFQN